jgi:hypothetical protein
MPLNKILKLQIKIIIIKIKDLKNKRFISLMNFIEIKL